MHVLIIGKVWPEPLSSAAGSRMLEIIRLFRRQGWQVSFASAAGTSEYSSPLEAEGVSSHTIELNNSSFDDFIKTLQPGIVLFDRFSTEEQYGWRVTEHCPGALRILDTEDLHSLRAARHQALKENRQLVQADLANDITKREMASIYRCDMSLIISKYEMLLLQNVFKVDRALLHYLPFLPAPITQAQVNSWPTFSERKNFISIGNFLHEPNWDAVQYLKRDIWPLIRKALPKAEVEIYGAYPTQKVFELHQPKVGFLIKGRAANAGEVMRQARVCLAPLRFGAGLKGKLMEAMHNGTPSVTTPIGAESMHGQLPWAGAVAGTASDFAGAAIALYTQESTWHDAQQNGLAINETCFNSIQHIDDFLKRVTVLLNNLHNHRQNNFIGSMLLHHSLQSSKYMALWIEAKNK